MSMGFKDKTGCMFMLAGQIEAGSSQ